MNRILLILFIAIAGLSACKKENTTANEVKAQGVIDDNLVSAYLTSHNLTAKQVDTSGVRYIIDTLGTGSDLITTSTQITVGYTGTLMTTGTVFAETNNFHPSFVLGQVIRGWQLGIPKIKKGGVITLFVPSRYAYGPYPQPQVGLPANAVLIFHITLYNITN